jgi:hypothetical protein
MQFCRTPVSSKEFVSFYHSWNAVVPFMYLSILLFVYRRKNKLINENDERFPPISFVLRFHFQRFMHWIFKQVSLKRRVNSRKYLHVMHILINALYIDGKIYNISMPTIADFLASCNNGSDRNKKTNKQILTKKKKDFSMYYFDMSCVSSSVYFQPATHRCALR